MKWDYWLWKSSCTISVCLKQYVRLSWRVRETFYLGKCLKSNGIWNLKASTDDGKAIIMNSLCFQLAKISPYNFLCTTSIGQKLSQFPKLKPTHLCKITPILSHFPFSYLRLVPFLCSGSHPKCLLYVFNSMSSVLDPSHQLSNILSLFTSETFSFNPPHSPYYHPVTAPPQTNWERICLLCLPFLTTHCFLDPLQSNFHFHSLEMTVSRLNQWSLGC